MSEAAGRITVLYHPPGEISDAHGVLDVGGVAGHVAVLVTDSEGKTYPLDVWSAEGKPWGAPLYMNDDPTRDLDRYYNFSQISWSLTRDQLDGALAAIRWYYEHPMDYAVFGQSCVNAVLDVVREVGIDAEQVLRPDQVWSDLQELASELPDMNTGLCEPRDYVSQTSDPTGWENFDNPAEYVSIPGTHQE